MESQVDLREGGGADTIVVIGGTPLVTGTAIFGQRPPILPTPFFHDFLGAGNQ